MINTVSLFENPFKTSEKMTKYWKNQEIYWEGKSGGLASYHDSDSVYLICMQALPSHIKENRSVFVFWVR